MPKEPCPSSQTRNAVTKECRDKKKPGPKPKRQEKYTEAYLKALPYADLLAIHKKLEANGIIVMRKKMKRDADHLVERILRKQQ